MDIKMSDELLETLIHELQELKSELRKAKINKIEGRPITELDVKLEADIQYYKQLLKNMGM